MVVFLVIYFDIISIFIYTKLHLKTLQSVKHAEKQRHVSVVTQKGFDYFFSLLSRCWSQLYPSFVTVTLKAFRPSLIEEIIYPNWRLNMSASKLRAKRWHSCQMLAYHSRMLQCLSWPMNKCRGQKQCRIINKGITGLVTPPKFFRD